MKATGHVRSPLIRITIGNFFFKNSIDPIEALELLGAFGRSVDHLRSQLTSWVKPAAVPPKR